MPTWLTHGWRAWFAPHPPTASQSRAGAGPAGEGVQDSVSAPPPHLPTGPGRNPECAAPTLGGPSPGSVDHFLLGSPGWALLLPRTPRLQAGGILPRGPPAVGPLDHPGLALIGWARGSVYRQPSLWRREPGGEGGGGSWWLEERSPGIRMPNEGKRSHRGH